MSESKYTKETDLCWTGRCQCRETCWLDLMLREKHVGGNFGIGYCKHYIPPIKEMEEQDDE